MLDGTRAWMDATRLAASGAGPAFALCRPAGHHATRDTAMGFGLVNFACAAVAAHLAAAPAARVAILDWDVHHGNGVASIFRDEPRVRYCSLHEAGGFPGTGGDGDGPRGAHAHLLHLPLPKGAGAAAYHHALRHKALPFLLGRAAADGDADAADDDDDDDDDDGGGGGGGARGRGAVVAPASAWLDDRALGARLGDDAAQRAALAARSRVVFACSLLDTAHLP